MDIVSQNAPLAPFSLRDTPALIERIFPAQKIGAEAQKERKAVRSQTLPTLGSYWKGRKPLILVRACILASLLPATADPEGDLEVFESLLGMDIESLLRRRPKIGASIVAASPAVNEDLRKRHLEIIENGEVGEKTDEEEGEEEEESGSVTLKARWRSLEDILADDGDGGDIDKASLREERQALQIAAFKALPFAQRVALCERMEQVELLGAPEDALRITALHKANAYLGTSASTLPELIQQLGVARYGHSPRVGDPFSGGGSIPFEAARIGCEALASDLNPVAALLTWGALNLIGGNAAVRQRVTAEQRRILAAVDADMTELGFEHDSKGNRAKALLYCLEAVDPQTGWLIPLLPSRVIAPKLKLIARLKPNPKRKCFDIEIVRATSKKELDAAEIGTVQESQRADPDVVYTIPDGKGEAEWRIPMARLRGDGDGPELPDGTKGNLLRRWSLSDIRSRPHKWDSKASPVLTGAPGGRWVGGDVWQERLYCIQWIKAEDLQAGLKRPSVFYAAPTEEDLKREESLGSFVESSLANWQESGWVPDMVIEEGVETARLLRERGWTYWHHLFNPRQLLTNALFGKHVRTGDGSLGSFIMLPKILDNNARLVRWKPSQGGGLGGLVGIFSNQALNTLYNYAARGVRGFDTLALDVGRDRAVHGKFSEFHVLGAKDLIRDADIWIYDPPYADAVHYHEITEFFIAWLRRATPAPFDKWTWDSRRPLAIQGKGDHFRTEMVAAFRAMANHMPDNGLQVCMFTHKDAGVWADLAQIVWSAGLKVTAAWYVSTETTSEQKQGGYVQGTVLMVLRKRMGEEHGFRSDLIPEVRDRVARQVATLTGLNQTVRGKGRDENVFSDADIQMAGYAAALEVLTSYTHIDGVDMTREALRPRDGKRTTEGGIVEEMITLAVQTAIELMVPAGIPEGLWERFGPDQRFYLKMTASEAEWSPGQKTGKLDEYQNFARVYRASDWENLMAEKSPNNSRLKNASELKRSLMTGQGFSVGPVRPVLYAIAEVVRATDRDEDPKSSGDRVLHFFHDHFGIENWIRQREPVRLLAAWFGAIWQNLHPKEAVAARIVSSLVASERLGG